MARPGELAGHAFISYVREDSRQADQLQRALEGAGIRVWRDTADLWPGQDWRTNIRRAITDDALVFVACFSQLSVRRERSYQYEELALAIEELRRRRPDGQWLIPVRFDDCDIPDLDLGGGRTLASIHRVDLFGDESAENAARLLVTIRRILPASSAAAAADASVDRRQQLADHSGTLTPKAMPPQPENPPQHSPPAISAIQQVLVTKVNGDSGGSLETDADDFMTPKAMPGSASTLPTESPMLSAAYEGDEVAYEASIWSPVIWRAVWAIVFLIPVYIFWRASREATGFLFWSKNYLSQGDLLMGGLWLTGGLAWIVAAWNKFRSVHRRLLISRTALSIQIGSRRYSYRWEEIAKVGIVTWLRTPISERLITIIAEGIGGIMNISGSGHPPAKKQVVTAIGIYPSLATPMPTRSLTAMKNFNVVDAQTGWIRVCPLRGFGAPPQIILEALAYYAGPIWEPPSGVSATAER